MYAVVTGASRGIGKAIARIFALHGYDLLLTSQNEDKLLQTVAEFKKDFPDISIDAQAMDIGIKEKAVLFAGWAAGKADTIDVLVNNAGIAKDNAFPAIPWEDWDAVTRTTLDGFYNVTRALVMPMP